MMQKLKHKGAASSDGSLRVKTFIFELDDATEGYADSEVNYFCESHNAAAMVLDRCGEKLIYRVLYKEREQS